MQAKLLKAYSIRLSLVKKIIVLRDRVKIDYLNISASILEPLYSLLIEKEKQGYSTRLELFPIVVGLCKQYFTSATAIQMIAAKEAMLTQSKLIVELCCQILAPYYLKIKKNAKLNEILLNRNDFLFNAIMQNQHNQQFDVQTLNLLHLFYIHLSKEDILFLNTIKTRYVP